MISQAKIGLGVLGLSLLSGLVAVAAEKHYIPQVPVDISLVEVEGGGYGFQSIQPGWFYTYDKDEPGKSNCLNACAEKWVPVYPSNRQAQPLGTDWTLYQRPDDGFRQWIYKGKPIYTFGTIYDKNPQTPTPEDMGTEWHKLVP